MQLFYVLDTYLCDNGELWCRMGIGIGWGWEGKGDGEGG